MSRFLIIGAAALATALPLAPAAAQSEYGYSDTNPSITVTAPRARQTGRGSGGAPRRTIETDSVVNTSEIDLNTMEGRRELDMRVAAAADQACSFLDQHYQNPYPTTDNSRDCRKDAVSMAQGQVRDALERASYSYTAAYAGY